MSYLNTVPLSKLFVRFIDWFNCKPKKPKQLRQYDGLECPACGSNRVYKYKSMPLVDCDSCGHTFEADIEFIPTTTSRS